MISYRNFQSLGLVLSWILLFGVVQLPLKVVFSVIMELRKFHLTTVVATKVELQLMLRPPTTRLITTK